MGATRRIAGIRPSVPRRALACLCAVALGGALAGCGPDAESGSIQPAGTTPVEATDARWDEEDAGFGAVGVVASVSGSTVRIDQYPDPEYHEDYPSVTVRITERTRFEGWLGPVPRRTLRAGDDVRVFGVVPEGATEDTVLAADGVSVGRFSVTAGTVVSVDANGAVLRGVVNGVDETGREFRCAFAPGAVLYIEGPDESRRAVPVAENLFRLRAGQSWNVGVEMASADSSVAIIETIEPY